ncbi:MAG TPA: O-antigen ligase family protein, partial [Terriglobales bacterium]|nr:O-antigen ligase family protein [Terriglobales bacterium]
SGVLARMLRDGEPLAAWFWKGRFQKWMLLYAGVAMLSATVLHPLEAGAARSLFRLASYILFYYAVTAWIKDAAQLRKAVIALLTSTIGVCLVAFTQAAQGGFGEWYTSLYANQSEIIAPWTGRVSSVFLGVNFLAGYLVLVLPLALAVQVAAQESKLRRAAQICFFLGVVALVLTQSRGAYLAFLAMLWIALRTVLKSRRARWRFLPGLALAVVIGGVISYTLTQDVEGGVAGPSSRERFTTVDETTAERLLIYAAAWNMFVESPATGIGYGNFRAHFNSFTGDAPTDLWDAHCLYLKVLAETGLPGFLCFFAMLGSVVLLARRRWRESKWSMERIFAVAVMGGIATVLAQGAVESLVDLPQFGSLLWLLPALFLAANQIEQPGEVMPGSFSR